VKKNNSVDEVLEEGFPRRIAKAFAMVVVVVEVVVVSCT
jgi:hypothetical protein